jgi:hypothetical protein
MNRCKDGRAMHNDLWVWPSDPREQSAVLRKLSRSEHVVTALKAIAKSAQGLSNAEIDEALGDNSHWMTIWVVRQLLALGFIEYKVDLFGGPGRYTITETGRQALATITGQAGRQTVAQAPAQTR